MVGLDFVNSVKFLAKIFLEIGTIVTIYFIKLFHSALIPEESVLFCDQIFLRSSQLYGVHLTYVSVAINQTSPHLKYQQWLEMVHFMPSFVSKYYLKS